MVKAPREPELARPTTGVKMPQPEPVDDALFGDEPPAVEPAAEPVDPLRDWAPFPESPAAGRYGAPPYDHAPVSLTADGLTFVVGQWQVSRRWDGSKKRWSPMGFWALRATGGRPISFEPKGWREWRD